jgi:NAD(P)-dependent dehydrogenase (short-subunit alcohol dehydrogenase family)
MHTWGSQLCRRLSRAPNRLCRHIGGGAEHDRRRQCIRHATHHQPHRTRHGLSVRFSLFTVYLHHMLTLLLRTMSCSKKGLILNVGSFAGASPTPMLAVYSGSKAFLRTWSDSLTAELTPKGITVEHVNTYFVVRLLYFVGFSG